MLTLANINATQAKTYYKRENYYSQEDAQANSEWQGRGASQHGLSSAILDLAAYENIVNGLSPDGQTHLRQKQNHKDKNERAGIDLTFSAPKSVSIACLVGGDSRLEEAHRTAVSRTVDLIESRYAETRINGQRVKTGNLIVAKWHHDTSRELDPHLHSHCLIMNCTQSPDGRWRSLSNEAFYRNKILLGQIYRNELALECRKLGYEIEPHPKELFEIKGYSREQIEAFSKRHEQIKEKLALIGAEETTENKVWAWRQTRVRKNHEIDRKEMLPYWHEEADLYGITHPVPQQDPQLKSVQEVESQLTAAVAAGIEHCSERKVAFRAEEIEKFVTTETRPFSISQLEEAIASNSDLIRTFDNRYTTESALTRELATIRLMQQGKGQFEPIASSEFIEGYLENKKLTQGQLQAITITATSTDAFIAWQGVAGAGKTYALKELQQIAQGYTIKGFAPSSQAAKVLGEELGIEANTVAYLLVFKQPKSFEPNQIWVVDEAGLLSAKDAYALMQRATAEQARVILVGDTRQLSAVEAGNPFKSLQQAGIQTAYLNQSLRQKTPDLQKAVNLAAAGEVAEAIAHLEQVGRIKEIADVGERAAAIADKYVGLSPEERQQTLILAGTHKERWAIIEQTRAALKQEGTLGYGVQATQLKARDLTKVQARYTHHYAVGDVVVPVREYRRLKLHKFQPYKVEAIAKDKLTLSDQTGNYYVVDPMQFRKTVYQPQSIEIAVGDRLRWTRNDSEQGRRNGQEFTVTGIEGQTATIGYQDGKTTQIDLYQPLHVDYALVSTTYSSQGKTADRVLISATADPTVSCESFYVAISRAKHNLQIFAQDQGFLLEQAQQSKAQETAIGVLQGQPAKSRSQSLSSTIEISTPQKQTNGYQQQSGPEHLTQENNEHSDKTTQHKDSSAQKLERLVQSLTLSGQSKPQQSQQLQEPTEGYHQQEEEMSKTKINSSVSKNIPGLDRSKVGDSWVRTDKLKEQLDQFFDAASKKKDRKRQVKQLPVPVNDQSNSNSVKALVDSFREIPLEEVAERLDLERDRYDKHKWKGEGQIISINDQKFYDHLEQKGGYGAIDLVMHVRGQDFKDAVSWLSNAASSLPVRQRSPQPQALPKPQLFQPPIPNESKWQEVRQYLVEQRGLPGTLVDGLHSSGKLYAAGVEPTVLEKLRQQGYSQPQKITNAVFLRQNLTEEATGASLRGVSNNSRFKGLATGSQRDDGWFSFTQGEGQLQRIVLAESAIDAMSAAALAKKPAQTMFVSTDGAGSVPIDWLRQQQQRGIQVVAAHDADRAGEEMAWRIAAQLPITRIVPKHGKDWNEQLLNSLQGKEDTTTLDASQWKLVAQAIGKSEAYVNRIVGVTQSGKPLPQEAVSAMQRDYNSYQQTSKDLWQWYEAAKGLGKSQAYLERIAEVVIAFHHPAQPTPLPQKTRALMQQDLAKQEQLLIQDLWQHYSQNADPDKPMKTAFTVALAATKDGHATQRIRQILEYDPLLVKIQQRFGEQAVQNHLEAAIRNTNQLKQSQNQSYQASWQQQQYKQGRDLEQ